MTWDTIPRMVLSAAGRFGDAEAVVDGPLRLAVRVSGFLPSTLGGHTTYFGGNLRAPSRRMTSPLR